MFRVDISDHVTRKAARQFRARTDRLGDEFDFMAGPVAAAVVAFGRFDDLPTMAGPSLRNAIIVDSMFGAVVFVGVLTGTATVEIADFEIDTSYWDTVAEDFE